jgi:hypothetical protein
MERTLQEQLNRAAKLGHGDLTLGPGALGEVAPEDQSVTLTPRVNGVERPGLSACAARETLEPDDFDGRRELPPECRGERLDKLTGGRQLALRHDLAPERSRVTRDVDRVLLERVERYELERPLVGGRQHHVGGRAVFVRA